MYFKKKIVLINKLLNKKKIFNKEKIHKYLSKNF